MRTDGYKVTVEPMWNREQLVVLIIVEGRYDFALRCRLAAKRC